MNFNSLDDFLISKELSVNAGIKDPVYGGELEIPLKGREIEATILFADISSFSNRTCNIDSTETLLFINVFFDLTLFRSIRNTHGIIDKYIGDEIMIIFSEEFGSNNSLIDALKTAKSFTEEDVYNFSPHMGLAKGKVTIGYVGTPLKYNCSAFGKPVTIASRCAERSWKKINSKTEHYASIVFPSEFWKDEMLNQIFHSSEDNNKNDWNKTQKTVPIKGCGEIEVMILEKQVKNMPPLELENWINVKLSELRKQNKYTTLEDRLKKEMNEQNKKLSEL